MYNHLKEFFIWKEVTMSHRISGRKCIQIFIVLTLLGAVFFHARSSEKMQQQVLSYTEEQTEDMSASVNNPRVNYVTNPIGIDSGDLFFSWEPETVQTAYEIVVSQGGETVWDSGIVHSDRTIQIAYQGPELSDATRYEYRIFVFDEENRMRCSQEAFFETAYINGRVFADAEFISMQPEESIYDDGQAVYYKAFELEKEGLRRATFYGSALGIYDAYLNGQRIGDDELKPGWTDYNDTLLYNTYDITSSIKESNTIAVMVGTGWWCGRNAFGTYNYHQPAFVGQIVLEYEDGSLQTIATGEDWNYTKNTAVRFADYFNGETYDFTKLTTSQISDGAQIPAEDVREVHISTDFGGEFKSYYGYNVKHVQELDCSPQGAYVYSEIQENDTEFGQVVVSRSYSLQNMLPLEIKKGETLIVDLGQNMTGVPYVEYKAWAGTQIDLQFAEMLNDSGDQERGNDGPKGSLYRANYRSATTAVTIISGGAEKESYAPTFFYTGFRYLSLTADRDITLYDIKGLFIGNSATVTGCVNAGQEQVDRLWQNVMWSQRNNFTLVATDCPQRDERLGWMGDIGSFAQTSMYNQDLYSFYKKWMADVRDAQTPEGAYTDTVPSVITTGSGNAGWAEAGILIPLQVYKTYGDLELLREHYPSMHKYMDYLASISSYKPEDKRMGPLTTYGDWLAAQLSDSNMLSAIWYQADALAMAETAALLGETADARAYEKLHEEINDYIMETYLYKMPWNRDGSERAREEIEYPLSQTEMLFLLSYSGLTEKQEQLIVADLNADIEKNEYKVMTGFAGTPILLPVLTQYGMTETAYRILLCEENPSWLYSVEQGATTIWERYDSYTAENGFADAAMNSFNHFNEGSVAKWMYESMLGIRVDLTQEEPVTIAPSIPADDIEISHVSGRYDSVYGRIELGWEKKENGTVSVRLKFPENVKAKVVLPLEGMEEFVITGGEYEWNGKYKLLE